MKNRILYTLKNYYERYDSLDLISSFGAMNLEFDNQNKNLLTSYATIVGLFNINKDKPKASNKTIKNIIDELNNSSIMPPIQDPSESLFSEDVYLDKEYKVFNGINTSSAYYVNSIIELMFYRKTAFDVSFKNKLIRFIKFCLYVSDSVFRKAYIKYPIDKDHRFVEDLLFPNRLDTYRKALFFDKNIVSDFISDEELKKYFLCSMDDLDLEECLRQTYPFYYNAPLLDCGDKLLVIDPTSICYFIKNLSLRLAKEYKCEDYYLNAFYDSVFDYSLERCKMLSGVFPNDEKQLFDEIDKKSRVYVYLVGNKVVLVVMQAFGENPLGSNCDQLFKKTFRKLKDLGYGAEKVYTFVVLSTYYGQTSFSSGFHFKNQPFIVPAADLETIQINERKNPFFLEDFTAFLNFYFPKDKMAMVFSITNLLGILHSKEYDFYLDDELSTRGAFLNLAFDFIYPYCIDAAKEQQNSVAEYLGINNPIRLIKYEDNIYFPNPILCPVLNVKPLYVRIGNYGFWIISKRDDETGLLVSRTLGYWLNKIKDTIAKYLKHDYFIQVALTEDDVSIYLFDDRRCELRYTRKYLERFSNEDNKNEIYMIFNILDIFKIFNSDISSHLKQVSSVPFRKITYSINAERDPYLRPVTQNLALMRCGKIYNSIIDDVCGDFLKDRLKVEYGIIKDPEIVINAVVEHLFDTFSNFVDKFDWIPALERCYTYCEKALSELLLFQDNLKHQFALYPEHAGEIEKNNDEMNVSSIGIRFVVEYLAAIKTTGKEIMDDVDIHYAISLVSEIIRWAKLSDGYRYKLIDSFTFLKSGRVGFNHDKLERFHTLLSSVAFNDSIRRIDSFNYEPKDFPFDKEINDAYLFEHGFTLNQLLYTTIAIFACGEEQEGDIKKASFDELLSVFRRDPDCKADDTTFSKIVDYLSIDFRGKYYDGKIKNRELHPWKYNREWSLMRKPIVRRGGVCYWGNRMVYHSYLFIMQSIRGGKEPSHSDSKDGIGVLNGKILEYIGEEFNDYCLNYLKNIMPDLAYDKCVKSINNKSIRNEACETLGDIDILAIDKAKKRIYLIETKRFYYSRNPSELDDEIKDMFVGTKKRKPFLTKELLRKEWIEKHITDVVEHYGLNGNGWNVRYTFLTYKPLISTEFVNYSINHIDLKNITLNYLRKLKQ